MQEQEKTIVFLSGDDSDGGGAGLEGDHKSQCRSVMKEGSPMGGESTRRANTK